VIPSIDLILTTLERALTATILPAAGNASAKEEASIGILMTRWLRDVGDHVVDAERASHRDCRRALEDVALLLANGATGPQAATVREEAGKLLASRSPEAIAAVREEARLAKSLLARALRATRAEGDDACALAIRARLAALAGREIERECSFGRATGIDPDAATVEPLSVISRDERSET
jgi:fumarylacetoacetate (FAA) hydrolase family protein